MFVCCLTLQAFGILVTTPGAVPSGLSAVVAAYVMLTVLVIAAFIATIGRHCTLLPDSKEVRILKSMNTNGPALVRI